MTSQLRVPLLFCLDLLVASSEQKIGNLPEGQLLW